MAAMKAGPAVPTWLAAGLIGVVIGGAGGYYGATWNEKKTALPPGMTAGGGGAPGGGGIMGGPGGGGPGGGGAQDHPNAAALIRTVSSLATLEKTRGRELSGEQRAKVAEAAAALKSDAAMTEAQCEEKLNALKASLSQEQQDLLEELSPRRGRGGGGGGGGRPGGMMAGGGPGGNSPGGNSPGGNSPGGNGPGGSPGMIQAAMGGSPGGGPGGGGGGFAQIDYEHPFKEGRGRERLEELLTLLGK